MTEVKTFKDLEKEIIEPRICSLCGGCVSVCAINNINALEIERDKPKFTKSDQKICLDCGICYYICPRTSVLSSNLDNISKSPDLIGQYKFMTWAQTTNSQIMDKCQDGGVVTSIIKYLLETRQIDGAVVNIGLSNWKSFTTIVASSKELIRAAGTRYCISPNLRAFQKLKIYSPILERTKEVSLSFILSVLDLNVFEQARLAFVGCPCQVNAIKKMQILNVRPVNAIKYIIGLFCMENFAFSDLMKNKIEKELQINLKSIKKINIKKNFIITLKNDTKIEIPLKEIEGLINPNCLFCPDFSNMNADLSIGGIGAPQGHSVVLVRTEKGADLFERALYNKYITEYKDSVVNIRELKEKSLKLINRMERTKKERAIKNLQK